ncbi:MAG: Tim44 domain-containing protein [Desulfobaccales bacterium]|nr:Tim44 domain-containing protein [Desulfobaccales bacterium]
MFANKWIKGGLIIFTLMFLATWALQMDAWARAGGGRSSGSRGSRSAAPPKPYVAPTTPKPSQPSQTPTRQITPTPAPASQPSSFMRSFGGGLLGGLAGGLLFSSLFGGGAHAGGGLGGAGGLGGSGISLVEILLFAGVAYLVYRYIKNRRKEAVATAGYQSSMGTVDLPPQPTYPPVYDQPQAPEGDLDLEQGLSYIKQMDPSFEEAKFQDQCMDAFFKIQGAYANRDMAGVRNLLTDQMYRLLQADADKLKADKQINRLENIAVRSVDVTEAWQESGADFITVRVYANLLDYTVDETSGAVLSGSKTDPVKFEEYWTFTRPVGNNPWQLSAINQPA